MAVRLWLVLCALLAMFVPLGGSGGTAQAAVPRGKADVYTLPASLSGLSGEPGITATLGDRESRGSFSSCRGVELRNWDSLLIPQIEHDR